MAILASNSYSITNVNDGQSSYTHIAYANIKFICKEGSDFTLSVTSLVRYGSDSRWVYKEFQAGTYTATNTLFGSDPASGVVKNVELISEFSVSNPVDKTHIGMYVDFNINASTNPSDYLWTLIKGSDGAQGIPGPVGSDGKTPYIHFAYSDNADGTGLTLTDNGQRYQGYYSDYTQADSTDKTKYRWADRWAKIEVGGRNYILKSQAEIVSAGGWVSKQFNLSSDLLSSLSKIKTVTISCDVEGSNVTNFNNLKRYGLYCQVEINGIVNYWEVWQTEDTAKKRISQTFTVPEGKTITKFYLPELWIQAVGDIKVSNPKIELGSVPTDHSLAQEDIENQINSKADQEKVVYKTDISVTDEGIVHSASKTVNGQTIASMIAQRAEWVEIIANLLKVKGDMIVDGTIGANKLSVATLSALTADLGKISGGSLELLESVAQATSVDAWGNFTIPAHKWGLYIDNIGAISSGTPVRKSSSESTASDMPVAVLASGQLRFARVNQNNDLCSVLHNGLSDKDNGAIGFAVAPDGTNQLWIQANGQIVIRGTNYTWWNSTGVAGVFYKRQGDVVALKMQVTTTANQAYSLGKIPVSLVPIQNSGTMMRVTAWTADQSIGRNLQINSDGSMSLLASNRGDTFNTQVTWII